MIPSEWNIQEKHQESPNSTHEKPRQGDYIKLCSVWQFHIFEQQTETHEVSCWRKLISLCSVCWGINQHEPQKVTHRDTYCGESITLWSLWFHLKSYASKITYPLCHCMKKHMKLHPVESSYQCALCGKWFISWNNKQWYMKSHAGDNPYICALCNQLLQEIFSFGNVMGRQKKTSWEDTATQSLLHTTVCCWWKVLITICVAPTSYNMVAGSDVSIPKYQFLPNNYLLENTNENQKFQYVLVSVRKSSLYKLAPVSVWQIRFSGPNTKTNICGSKYFGEYNYK